MTHNDLGSSNWRKDCPPGRPFRSFGILNTFFRSTFNFSLSLIVTIALVRWKLKNLYVNANYGTWGSFVVSGQNGAYPSLSVTFACSLVLLDFLGAAWIWSRLDEHHDFASRCTEVHICTHSHSFLHDYSCVVPRHFWGVCGTQQGRRQLYEFLCV